MALSPAYLWALLGAFFCLMEIFVPSAFTESALGFSAFGVAVLSLVIPQLWLQALLWVGLSALVLFWFRRLSQGRRNRSCQLDDLVATTLTSIPTGATGRVQYEGGSWQARSYDPDLEIAANQPVHVVEQKGNTLIVMPDVMPEM